MPDHRILVVATLAGCGVVLATTVSRRLGGTIGGLLAASPITPTAATFLLEGGANGLAAGVASIAATLMAILAGLLLAARGRHLWPLAAIAPVAWFLSAGPPAALVLLCLLLAAAIAWLPRAASNRSGSAAPLPVAVRFLAGAVPVLGVAAATTWLPQVAPLVAVFPVLFVSCVLAAGVESPDVSIRMLAGGGAGSLGVVAFVFASAAAGIGFGWLAFAVVSIGWATLTRAIQRPRQALKSANTICVELR